LVVTVYQCNILNEKWSADCSTYGVEGQHGRLQLCELLLTVRRLFILLERRLLADFVL